tara:strand:- start:686 stop:835 length:150 start_codon:yes stop_codon:yes gene_type:complete
LFEPTADTQHDYTNHDRRIREIKNRPELEINEIYDCAASPARGSKKTIG